MLDPQELQEYSRKYDDVMRRAYTDEAFRARLVADPAAVMAEAGLQVPPGVEIRAVESTDTVYYLALPPRPPEDLSDEQLDQVAGGASASTAGTAGTMSCLTGTLSTAATLGSAGCAG